MALPFGRQPRSRRESRAGCAYNCGVRWAAYFVAFVALIALGSSPSQADEALWTGSRTAEARTEALLKALRAAADHGLDPDWYRPNDLEKAIAETDKARAEQLIADTFVAYASDISTGRVRANTVDKDIDIQQRKVERADLLKAAAEASDFAAYLASLPPKGDYPALQKALAELRAQRAATSFTPLPSGDLLRPGMTDARVSILRKRLGELGLPTPPLGGPTLDFYDEPLAAVVKSYQETKGLTVDGVIGTNTTRSLNTSIDDRIEQVVANLERRRWLPEDLGSRHVLVNAGDYSMVFVDGGQRVFESLVIVGTPKDPTPEIQSVMHGFQTNPYWTVPQTISGEEYLPMLRRDPYALQAGGFKIFASWSDNNSEIDPATIDWSTIHREPGSYIDEDLRGKYTDLLFSADLHGQGERRRTFLYALVEHQSSPESFMVLRIFIYMGRIWAQFRRDYKDAKRLPGIIPVVVYQGEGGWTAATRFDDILDLDPEQREALGPYIPSFSFALDDLGVVSNEAIRDREVMTIYARLTLFFLKNAWNLDAFLESLLDFSELIQQHFRTPRGLEDFVMLMRYYTQVNDGLPEPLRNTFREAAGPEHREAVMTMWGRMQGEGKD